MTILTIGSFKNFEVGEIIHGPIFNHELKEQDCIFKVLRLSNYAEYLACVKEFGQGSPPGENWIGINYYRIEILD